MSDAVPPPSENAIGPVGLTGVGVARIRADESRRPDRLFDDPLAQAFVDASGWEPRATADGQAPDERTLRWYVGIQFWVVVRTRFLDDFLVTACRDGCAQVVLLGAGMDARGFRLPLDPTTHLYEVDVPAVLALKDRVLADTDARPVCERTAVPADLSSDWTAPLLAAGFDPARPTAWIAEGLLVYLSDIDNHRLLTATGELSAPGSRLGLTVAGTGFNAGNLPGVEVARMWQSEGPESIEPWLQGYGWEASVFDAAERAATYGRALPAGRDPSRSYGRLVDASRA